MQAAGLIPIVHASAGPLLDIVVPHNGQRTGESPFSFIFGLATGLTAGLAFRIMMINAGAMSPRLYPA